MPQPRIPARAVCSHERSSEEKPKKKFNFSDEKSHSEAERGTQIFRDGIWPFSIHSIVCGGRAFAWK